jgi:hypothetical protein
VENQGYAGAFVVISGTGNSWCWADAVVGLGFDRFGEPNQGFGADGASAPLLKYVAVAWMDRFAIGPQVANLPHISSLPVTHSLLYFPFFDAG